MTHHCNSGVIYPAKVAFNKLSSSSSLAFKLVTMSATTSRHITEEPAHHLLYSIQNKLYVALHNPGSRSSCASS